MVHSANADKHDGVSILVIDDEERIREACRMVLTDQGFQVSVAQDGIAGLSMIEKEHFDIILVDLMMPILSGFEVLSRVREMDPDAVVVVITGYATLEHSIEAMKQGAFDFIPKPFTPDQLRAVVSKSLKYTSALQDIVTAKSRLRVMINQLTEGVMTIDAKKRVVQVNPAFLQIIDMRGEYVIGQSSDEIITIEAINRLINQTLAMPPDTYAEFNEEVAIGGTATEQEKIYNVRCTPFRGRTGRNLGVITVLHDITAAKKMEQLKSDFVSTVSHEIRSPINSLLMQLKIILDGLAGEVTDKQKEILNRASEKMLNLNNLVTELLDLSRIESGLQIAQEKEEVDVYSFIEDQLLFHRPYAEDKKQTLVAETEEGLPPLFANKQNMEEVFSNLVTNAIKYSPAGGRTVIGARLEKNFIVFTISDTGFGIPEEDLDKVFTRFYRVKDENTRTIHGTGLGLSIVKGLIDSHQGNISIQSKVGKGTIFTISLPVADN